LDFYECNPISRLPLSTYKNIDGVKSDLLLTFPQTVIVSKKKILEIEEDSKKKAIIQHKQLATVQKTNQKLCAPQTAVYPITYI
jgi:hypothetical protein